MKHKEEAQTIICTLDKDLKGTPGWNYNWNTKELVFVTEEEALRNFYHQLLTGDTTDNIIGLRGIGPAKATKALEDCTTEEEMFNVALCMYGGNYDRVLENGRLLYIRRERGEMWTPKL